MLLKKAKGGEVIDLWVEMACNGMFGTGKNGLINPPEDNRTFCLSQGNYFALFQKEKGLNCCITCC